MDLRCQVRHEWFAHVSHLGLELSDEAASDLETGIICSLNGDVGCRTFLGTTHGVPMDSA